MLLTTYGITHCFTILKTTIPHSHLENLKYIMWHVQLGHLGASDFCCWGVPQISEIFRRMTVQLDSKCLSLKKVYRQVVSFKVRQTTLSLWGASCCVTYIWYINILHKNYTYVICKHNLITSLLFQKCYYISKYHLKMARRGWNM
jgi:hypothetical protein